jgi:(2Fe-2S) ferredoxin
MMTKPEHHIFVCGSFRANETPQGVCNKKGSMALLRYLEGEVSDRGLGEVSVSSTGCFKACDRGPILVVYPENWCFGRIESKEAVDAVIESLEKGEPPGEYLIP